MSDWRKLFPASTNHSLDYFPPEDSNGTPLVSPPLEVFEEGANEWKNTIIAQFLGKPLGFMTVQRTLTQLWEKHGNIHIRAAGNNLFIIQFENETALNWILENGPWHVQHSPMILRKWEPNIGKIDFALDNLPIWFHLHNVPLDLYTRSGLSYIASAIGVPLYMDSVTAAKKRLAYAKVCVEASAAIDPPEKIDILMQDGSIASIAVTIPWKPSVCRTCSVFGHSDRTCNKNKNKVEKVWRPKEKMNEPGEKEPITAEAEAIPVAEAQKIQDTVVIHRNQDIMAVQEPKSASSKGKNNKGILHFSSSKKIGSSTNKFALLNEEICSLNFDKESIDDMIDENVQPKTSIGNDKETWEQMIENATYVQKKTRAAAKEASHVWTNLKPKKVKLMAKGAKKGSLGPNPLAPCN